MPTVWEILNTSLPEITYENETAAGQGKGSTEWAAHSHTPVSVEEWTDFGSLVAAEGTREHNQRVVDSNFDLATRFEMNLEQLEPCSEEEHVTSATAFLLSNISIERYDLSDGIYFPRRNNELTAKPDIIAMKRDNQGLGVGPSLDYASPAAGRRAQIRRETVQLIKSLYRFPFETKPTWKFPFLQRNDVNGEASRSHEIIINLWEVPHDFDAEKMQAQVPLPLHWPSEKKKVFHLVRQIYGQMVADHCRYGVFHTYDRWIFCKRSQDGTLSLSRSFRRDETSPSVLQAIKTLIGFDDYRLSITAAVHPSSASRAPPIKKSRSAPQPRLPPGRGADDSNRGGGKPTGGGEDKQKSGNANLATTLSSSELHLFDRTDNVLLLTTPRYPSVLVKMQNSRSIHVLEEMSHEAEFYSSVQELSAVEEVVPKFYGYSTHLGVAISCLELESDDFDDIDAENLPMALKRSALHAVQVLSNAHILHNDLELRNFVRCRNDPMRAKIIDFGRAEFSDNSKLLAEQVQHAKVLLGVMND